MLVEFAAVVHHAPFPAVTPHAAVLLEPAHRDAQVLGRRSTIEPRRRLMIPTQTLNDRFYNRLDRVGRERQRKTLRLR